MSKILTHPCHVASAISISRFEGVYGFSLYQFCFQMVLSINDSFSEEMLSKICSHVTFLQFQGVPSCMIRLINFKESSSVHNRQPMNHI